jgi:hypothetical protein
LIWKEFLEKYFHIYEQAAAAATTFVLYISKVGGTFTTE